ncbi:MAG: hypothetical protein C5B50_22305 [Verrucomicrobia bacterium]|nr:MAG: hypothetical protein C5B50_22305 [Verrucomicrobiota bacterium]
MRFDLGKQRAFGPEWSPRTSPEPCYAYKPPTDPLKAGRMNSSHGIAHDNQLFVFRILEISKVGTRRSSSLFSAEIQHIRGPEGPWHDYCKSQFLEANCK